MYTAGAERLVLPSFLLKHVFGKGQNALLTSPTLLWNEWRILVLARLVWFALTAGLRCKPPAQARGISPGSLFAHWEILCWSLPRSEKRPRIISRPHGAKGEARQRECKTKAPARCSLAGRFFVGYSQGANSDREYFRAPTERRAKPGSVSASNVNANKLNANN